MIKFQKKVLTLAVAASLAGLAGLAQASSVGGLGTAAAPTPWPALTGAAPNMTVAANTTSFTVASESLVVNYDIDLDPTVATPAGTLLGGDIVWIPTFGLNSGDLITFTFSGGLWMSNNAKLFADESTQANTGAVDLNGNSNTTDTSVEVASNFGTVDTTNGVSSITMRINNGLNLPEGLVLKLSFATGDYPTIRIPKSASGNVSVTVSATNSAGTVIGAAAATNVLFDIAKQVDFAVTTKATSQANVSDITGGVPTPRNHFVQEGTGAVATAVDDTSLLNSAAQFTIYNGAAGTNTVEDKIVFTGGGTDTFVIDVTPSAGGLNALNTATAGASYIELGTAGVDDANVALVADTTNGKFSVTLNEGQLDAIATSVTDIALLTVKGDTPIDERSWTMSAKLARSTEGTMSYAGGESHVWSTNGTVLQAPFFTLATGYVPRFYITNTSGSSVSYTITIQTDPGSSPAGGAGTVTGGTINAKSGVLLKGPDIATGQRGTAIFTAAAPCNVIEGVFQVRSSSTGDFDSIPLLKPTACIPN